MIWYQLTQNKFQQHISVVVLGLIKKRELDRKFGTVSALMCHNT